VSFRSIIEVYSGLMHAKNNEAEMVNRIPSRLVSELSPTVNKPVWKKIDMMAGYADAIVAHNAEFDRRFVDKRGAYTWKSKPWICTHEDITWPRQSGSGNLVSLALDHGVGVTHAHRALQDCLLLARMFEAVDSPDLLLENGLERALTPKFMYQAVVSYDDRHLAKAAGFHWDGESRMWLRRMTEREAERFSFRLVKLS
jgi:DNA polymerase-3 subunit epsilon